MRRLALSIISGSVLFSASAYAQTVVDQSDKELDPEKVKAIIASFTFAITDPLSAQIIQMRPAKPDSPDICGFINAKNQYGGYMGFKPFRYVAAFKELSFGENAHCD